MLLGVNRIVNILYQSNSHNGHSKMILRAHFTPHDGLDFPCNPKNPSSYSFNKITYFSLSVGVTLTSEEREDEIEEYDDEDVNRNVLCQ